MQISRFFVENAWSDVDRCYVGVCPSTPYCATHGDTIAEAAREIETAIQGHLESYRRQAYPFPQMKERHPIGNA